MEANPTGRPTVAVAHFPGWMRIGFWACVVIAVAVVLRRGFALLAAARPAAPAQMAALDAFFQSHARITWIHILCALVFVLMLPFLFWRRTCGSRALQRAFFVMGFAVGATAYAMTVYAMGGWIERCAVLFFNSLFVGSLVRALLLGMQGDAVSKQRWVLRAVAVLLGIATTRPVMGLFFATSAVTHLTPNQFFGFAFWIGFSINTIAMEIWLRRRAQNGRTS